MKTNPNSNARHREYIGVLYIVLAALVFRVVLISLPRIIRWDEPDYLWLGKNLLTGRGYTITGVPELHYPPLFPLLSGSIYLLTSNPEMGSAFWYILLGALVVIPIYFLARRIYGHQVALLSALLVAFFPALSSAVLYWGTMTEPLFIFLVYSALCAATIALDSDKVWPFGIAGGLFSLAYLSRPEGIIWFAAFGILFVLLWMLRRQLLRWRTLAHLGIYLLAFVLLAAPYMIFTYRHSGKWMVTGKLGITYDIGEAVLERDPVLYDKVTASLDSAGKEILWWSNQRFEQSILDIFLDNPTKFLRRIWRNLRQMQAYLFSSTIFPLFLLAPVVLGWFRYPWSRRRCGLEVILWFGILPVLSFLPFHIEVRFFSPAFPAMLIWVAVGLRDMGAWLAETLAHWRFGHIRKGQVEYLKRWQPRAVVLLSALLMVYLGFTHARVIERGSQDLSYAHKEIGLWLKKYAPPDAAIMSRDLAISLYAERGFVASPRADYATYLDYARRKGATYLVVDERELRVLRPHLAFLLDDTNPPPELERVFSAVDGRGRTIGYRIKD